MKIFVLFWSKKRGFWGSRFPSRKNFSVFLTCQKNAKKKVSKNDVFLKTLIFPLSNPIFFSFFGPFWPFWPKTPRFDEFSYIACTEFPFALCRKLSEANSPLQREPLIWFFKIGSKSPRKSLSTFSKRPKLRFSGPFWPGPPKPRNPGFWACFGLRFWAGFGEFESFLEPTAIKLDFGKKTSFFHADRLIRTSKSGFWPTRVAQNPMRAKKGVQNGTVSPFEQQAKKPKKPRLSDPWTESRVEPVYQCVALRFFREISFFERCHRHRRPPVLHFFATICGGRYKCCNAKSTEFGAKSDAKKVNQPLIREPPGIDGFGPHSGGPKSAFFID